MTMRLKQLTITNFGIYEGENIFDFPYTADKKVSMIIGKNGSGKTTFLNAIKVSLFGSMVLRNSTITKSYEQYIMSRLNKTALLTANNKFGIRATFISKLHRFDGEFTIERSWHVDNGFKEIVSMTKDNSIIDLESQDSFFNAFYHAFPLDLFDIFYLDGEKIDQLSILNSSIINLLESSINLDLFKQLDKDLIKYASKKVNSKLVARLTGEKDLLEEKIERMRFEINGYEATLDDQRIELRAVENKLKKFKKSLKLNSTKIDNAKLEDLNKQIKELISDIEYDLAHFLPYTLLEGQMLDLRNSIEHESLSKKNEIITSALKVKGLKKELLAMFPDDQLKKMFNVIEKYYSTDSTDFIHFLNEEDYHNLHYRLSKIIDFNRSTLLETMNTLSNLEEEYKLLTRESEEIAAAKQSGQLDELLKLQSDVKILELDQESLKHTVQNLYLTIENEENHLKTVTKELWVEIKKHNISNVLDQIHNVIGKYVETIKQKKINNIENGTKLMFNKLIRKNNFVKKCVIGNESIHLIDSKDNRLDPVHLSAGEKQLFVLSLLFAILQTSERKVPLMFDTLLGRLDAEHRENVFREFIQGCPDQVIILATDSELANIDQKLINGMINTEYTIDFSKSKDKLVKAANK